MRIIVTGGAGFIGSHLVDAYLEAGHQVLVIDNLSTGRKANLNPQASFIKLDIRNQDGVEQVFRQFKPEVVNHHAAQTSVTAATRDPVNDAQINILGTINLLKSALEFGVKRFIFASSAAVYGEPSRLPVKETAKLKPVSPYGITKLAAERYCRCLSREPDLTTLILRYANVYGPRQRASSESGVISIFAKRLKQGKPLKIYGDGTQTRDFVFIEDIVKVNLDGLRWGDQEPLPAINVGTKVETSINDLARLMMSLTGTVGKVKYLPEREGDLHRSCLDNQRLGNLIKLSQLTSLRNGLKKMLD